MEPKIDFITIAVADLKKSVSFYENGFGLPTTGMQDENKEHCLFELENLTLVLYKRKDFLELTGNPAQTETSAGFVLSYTASSKEQVEKILKKAIEAGATKVGEPQDESWGYSAIIADPDGHQWEIIYMSD